MGRLEEVVSPAKWPRIEEPFRQVREGAIENLPEDLSCLIDKSVRGYLCSSRRRERGREGGRGGGIGANFWRMVCGYSVARMANINSTSVRSKSGFLSETVHGG